MRSRRLLLFVLGVFGAVASVVPAVASAGVAPVLEFGARGTGAGQVSDPAGSEYAPSGDLFVVDLRNRRIDVFSATGAFVRAFGKGVNVDGSDVCEAGEECKESVKGEGAGQLFTPNDLALLDGKVYVTDDEMNRVSVFSEAGEFLFAFGKEVDASPTHADVCTTACQEAEHGPEGGALYFPSGIAAAGGRLFIADQRHNRISVYAADGSWIEAFGKEVSKSGSSGICNVAANCQEGSFDESAGSTVRPRTLAAAGGDFYVGSEISQRIDVFTTAGQFVRAFGRHVAPDGADVCTTATGCVEGEQSAAPAAVPFPSGIAIAADGSIFVSDYGYNRISKFDSSGVFVHAWGEGVVDGAPELQVCTVTCLAGRGGVKPASVNVPYGLAIDSLGRLAVSEEGGIKTSVSRISVFEDSNPPPPTPPVIPPADNPGTSSGSKPAPSAPSPSPTPLPGKAKPGKLVLDKETGTATLFVNVTGPGKLVLSGTGVKKASRSSTGPATLKVPVKATGRQKKKLLGSGKVTLKGKLTFTSTDGIPKTTPKNLTLKLKLP
jgi:hypothetical protein